jgi:DNA-binding transcriptional LysR family regulator
VNLHQLKIFDAVARHRSYTRAAQELHLTQPAVSAQVRDLERALGAPFFERVGRQISFTAAGRELHAYARRILDLVEEARTAMEDLKRLGRGRVTVAAVSTAGAYVVPPLLGAFRARHPGIVISLEVTNRATVHRRLTDNEADLTIMGRPPEGIPHVAKPFLSDQLVVVAGSGSPLARMGRLPLERLAREPFVTREPGSGTRLAAEEVFREHGITAQISLELGNTSAVKEAVAAGLGVAILSRHALTQELRLRRLVVLNVEGFPVSRQWYVVHREDKRLSHAARAFMEFLLTSAETVLAGGPGGREATASPRAGRGPRRGAAGPRPGRRRRGPARGSPSPR